MTDVRSVAALWWQRNWSTATGAASGRQDRLLSRTPLRRSRVLWATIATATFSLVVLPFTTRASFQTPTSHYTLGISVLLHGLFVVGLWLFVLLVLRVAQAVRLGSLRHRRWLQVTIASLAVNLLLLAVVYPGYWVMDEFYTLGATVQWSTFSWQGYFTNIFYTFGLFLLPSPMGILLLQIVTIAVVTGYVVSAVSAALRRPWLAAALVPVLVSFPVLLNNLYPLRLTMYAYLLALLIVRLHLVVELRSRDPRTVLPFAFIGASGLIAVLAFWRSEGVVLLALVPVFFVLAGVHRMRGRLLWKPVALAAGGALLVGAAWQVTVKTADPGYQMPTFINPLSTMVQGPLSPVGRAKDLRAIDDVLDLDVLKRFPEVHWTPAFAQGVVRPTYAQHLSEFRRAYASLVVHNPGPFLDNRWRALAAGNSMESSYLPQVWSQDVYSTSTPRLDSAGLLMQPLNRTLRAWVIQHLLLWNDDRTVSPAGTLVWNALPIVLGLMAGLIVAVVRRRWVWAASASILLTNVVLLFLTEPAALFMYFFPAFLCGGLLIATAIALVADRRLDRRLVAIGLEGETCALEAGRPPLHESRPAMVVMSDHEDRGTARIHLPTSRSAQRSVQETRRSSLGTGRLHTRTT